MGRRRTLLAVVVVVASLAACGGTATDAASERSTTSATPTSDRNPRDDGFTTQDVLGGLDVSSSIGQPRHLEGTRRITVPVRFEGTDSPVTVSSIAVRSARFEPLPPEPKGSLLHPSRTVDLQVDLGSAVCDGGAQPTPVVHLEARVGAGPTEELVLPVPDLLLIELQERECSLAELADQVDVEFGPAGRQDGRTLEAEVVVTRRDSEDRIVLERLSGSVILTLEPGRPAEPVAALDPGTDEAFVPVVVTAARCDAHGLSGSQKTFVFPVWIAVGDGPAVHLELRPPPALEEAMRAVIDACIAGDA